MVSAGMRDPHLASNSFDFIICSQIFIYFCENMRLPYLYTYIHFKTVCKKREEEDLFPSSCQVAFASLTIQGLLHLLLSFVSGRHVGTSIHYDRYILPPLIRWKYPHVILTIAVDL